MWDLGPLITSLDTPGASAPKKDARPFYKVESHGKSEGFAMDWSLVDMGR